MLEAFRPDGYSFFMNAEIEVLSLFLSYSRTLSLSGTPQRKIAAAKWEIIFQNRLTELEERPAGNGASGATSDTQLES